MLARSTLTCIASTIPVKMTKTLILSVSLVLLSFVLKAQDNLYRVKADKLNVRETADSKSKIIGFVPQGENVAVLDSTNKQFFKIKVTNGEGWVSSEYLSRISAPNKHVQAKRPVTVEVPKVTQDYSNIIFFAVVALVMGTILYFVFKYSDQSRILIGITTIVVLVVCYFCFITFVQKKVVSGTFVSDSETQYQSFDFKSNDSVVVKDVYTDSLFTSKYVIEDDMIKLYDQQNLILLLIRDDHTLIGEGFTKGTFSKR